MASNEQRKRTTRDAILDASIALFISDGFEKTSMDAIAAAANLAKGTLYYHYASKEGIVDAIVERYASQMEDRLRAIAEDAARSPLEKLEAMAGALEALNSAHFADLHRMRFIDIHDKTVRVMIARFAPYLAGIIGEGNRAGAWKAAYPLEYAEILIAASQPLLDPEFGVEDIPRRIAAFAEGTALLLGMDGEEAARIFRSIPEGRQG